MGNKIDLITKYSSEAWDKVYVQESRASLLDGNKKLIKTFEGSRTVKIAKFSASGLSNYKRANTVVAGHFKGDGHDQSGPAAYGYGYQTADMALTWETFTMECDRAAQYRIDLMDNEETDALAIGMCTTEVSRTIMIPEVDAYCFSKIAGAAIEDGKVEEEIVAADPGLNQTRPVDALNNALEFFDNHAVPAQDQIIFASPRFLKMLRSTNELYKRLEQGEYKRNVSFLIEEYEGRPIVMVEPNRFKTKIELLDYGYTFGADSQSINFMVVSKSAVYHVVKYNKVRVFAPDVVQDYDGYKVNARIYHDVFVPDNQKVAVYVSLAPSKSAGFAVAPTLTAVSKAGAAQNGTFIGDIKVIPSTSFIAGVSYKLGDDTLTVPAAGTQLPGGFTALDVTTEIAASTNTHAVVAAVDTAGRVVAASLIELVKGE